MVIWLSQYTEKSISVNKLSLNVQLLFGHTELCTASSHHLYGLYCIRKIYSKIVQVLH